MPEEAELVHGLAEAEQVTHDHRLVVGGVVADLHDPHLVDALGQAGHDQRQHVVGEPGVDAVDVQRGVAGATGLLDPREDLLGQDAVGPLQQDGARGHDVHALAEHPDEVLDRLEDPVVGHRGVHHRVRGQRHQLVAVGGGGDPQLATELGQHPGVLAVLVGVGDPHTDQLEVGVGVDAGDRVPTDGARRPDDDAQRLLGDDL